MVEVEKTQKCTGFGTFNLVLRLISYFFSSLFVERTIILEIRRQIVVEGELQQHN